MNAFEVIQSDIRNIIVFADVFTDYFQIKNLKILLYHLSTFLKNNTLGLPTLLFVSEIAFDSLNLSPQRFLKQTV